MSARVIAAAVAVTLLVGVCTPPLGAQQPATPTTEPAPATQVSSPGTPPPTEMTGSAPSTPAPATTPATEPSAPTAPSSSPVAAAPVPSSSAPAPRPAPVMAATEPASSHSPRTDVYDVAGGVVTALKAPFNVALCALGGVLGVAVFAVTLGSGYRAAARTVEEGCSGPWVVTGDDLRPERGRPASRLSDLHPGELEGR
ncbi:MAG TPA: hypothetical protein VNK50_06635 [Calidithermus sp.]|nr:hypothetical protein [Calidithermus sp.]